MEGWMPAPGPAPAPPSSATTPPAPGLPRSAPRTPRSPRSMPPRGRRPPPAALCLPPASDRIRVRPPYALTMPITRMNHAVLYVTDVQRSVAFYRDVLDFRVKLEIPGKAAFIQAPASQNDHDLGLFQIGSQAGPSQAGRSTVGLYHIAWE